MKIFFWDFQDDNDIIRYISITTYRRQWLLFISNLLVLVFIIIGLYRTWKYYKQCMFEMMPLSINLVATFILLLLKLFEKGYQFALIGHFIEIFTYFLFCYTFAIMYTVISTPHKKQKVQRIWNIVLIIMCLLLIILSTLVFVGIISKKCEKNTQEYPAIISLIFQFGSFIPTGYFGIHILTQMNKKQDYTISENGDTVVQQLNISQFKNQIYIKQRKKQIRIVLAMYIISMVIRLVISCFMIFMWEDLFQCDQIDNVFIITSDFIGGQMVLVFAQINQLLPHIVIPIAMYVVPLKGKFRSRGSINMQETLLDQDQDDSDSYSHQQNVKNRVSSLLASRISEDSSPAATTKRNNKNVKVPDFLKQ